jgi:peptidoglycan hydrolase-like protein with peptidoglycan-binding domain
MTLHEVRKLQTFLNNYEGEKLSIDGKYKKTDYDAVKRFQSKYSTDVLISMELPSHQQDMSIKQLLPK